MAMTAGGFAQIPQHLILIEQEWVFKRRRSSRTRRNGGRSALYPKEEPNDKAITVQPLRKGELQVRP